MSATTTDLGSPTNVLIVDDQAQNLVALEAVLEPLGQNLVKAHSGEEALKYLLSMDFSCILLDVQMPGMDGFETAALIKKRDKSRNIPIIFVTAISKDEEYVFRGYGVGAVDYIFKPINADVLRSKVSVFVDLSKKNERIKRQAELLRIRREKEVAELKRMGEERYRTLAESMPQIVWAADDKGVITYCNERWYLCAGLAARSTTERITDWSRILHADDVWSFLGEWEATVAARRDWEAEFRFGNPQAGYRWHLVRAVPVRGDGGEVTSWIGTSTDIDDRRKAEQALEAASRTKDEFLATLSHELRTPLNAILGWVQLIRGGNLDGNTVKRGLETIERNTKTQAQLVADLLDVSRIVSGKLHLDMQRVKIRGVVEAAIEAVRHSLEAKRQVLETRFDSGIGEVHGDPDRLQQIVWNLLSNAIKFTPPEGTVTVFVESAGQRVRIRVTDTGQGIGAEFLPYVFDRFRQADSTTTRSHGGLGLGLAIVSHLVQVHGGDVKAESGGEGQGAVFTVELPRFERAAGTPESGEWDLRPLTARMPTALAGIHVLLVEDEPDGRELVQAALERRGAEVTAVASVPEALAALGRGAPDILVSDIGLPGEDGYALVRRIRQRAPEEGGLVPAIALTAYASVQDRDRALAAGFQAHMTKPVEPAELSAAVSRLVRSSPAAPAASTTSPIATAAAAEAHTLSK